MSGVSNNQALEDQIRMLFNQMVQNAVNEARQLGIPENSITVRRAAAEQLWPSFRATMLELVMPWIIAFPNGNL